MTIKKTTVLICDRCGAEQTLSIDAFDSVAAVREAGNGWQRISEDCTLCRECAASYSALKAKHDAEMKSFLGK